MTTRRMFSGRPRATSTLLVPQSTVITHVAPPAARSASAAAWSPYPSVMRLGMYGMTVAPAARRQRVTIAQAVTPSAS